MSAVFLTLFGAAGIVFGFGDLAITLRLMRWRRDGRELPGVLRTWELIARWPWISIPMACIEIALGAGIVIATLV
jgi:hypothetical protein